MKTTINITGILPKTSIKSGKMYYIIGTDKGDFSCWSESVFTELQKKLLEKKPIDVDVQERGDFKTIIAIWHDGYVEPVSKSFEKQEFKTQTMYVSYAKDIFLELVKQNEANDYLQNLEQDMKRAIDLVKQAKDAFK